MNSLYSFGRLKTLNRLCSCHIDIFISFQQQKYFKVNKNPIRRDLKKMEINEYIPSKQIKKWLKIKNILKWRRDGKKRAHIKFGCVEPDDYEIYWRRKKNMKTIQHTTNSHFNPNIEFIGMWNGEILCCHEMKQYMRWCEWLRRKCVIILSELSWQKHIDRRKWKGLGFLSPPVELVFLNCISGPKRFSLATYVVCYVPLAPCRKINRIIVDV